MPDIELSRTGLANLSDHINSANAGLLLHRGLSCFEENKEKTQKKALFAKVTGVTASPLYDKAYARWLAMLAKNPQDFGSKALKIDQRLYIGLTAGSAVETGVMTHHSYGMPYIAGSSVKGTVRSYAENIGLPAHIIAVLFGHDEDVEVNDTQKIEAGAGCLVWHDAWWIPNTAEKYPFVAEVVTVHHQDYYSGNGDATDFDSPVPNQQMAVQGSFLFTVEGDEQWVKLALDVLQYALTNQGIGGKVASGYGYFVEDADLSHRINKEKNEQNKLIEEEVKRKKLEQDLTSLTDAQKLIKKFQVNLPELSQWQNKPQYSVTVEVDGVKYQFLDIYNIVREWTDIDDLKYAIEFFEVNLKIWSGKSLGQNKPWKERINPLKRIAGLI